jgi:short-subunit dehydrogenase
MFVVSCSMLGFVNRQFLRSTYDLMNRYGKQDSWVVVTGGSDGIGLEICEQMAAKGFNVCIVSRNQEKINEKLKLLIERFPKIKTRAVVFDFSTKTTIEQYKTEIADKLTDIDIAMLFLNAGYAQAGPFAMISRMDV